MSTIRIGTDERPLGQADPQWITQEIVGRRKDGLPDCVIVTIKTTDLSMHLATPACARGGVGGRPPTPREQAVFALWRKHGLDDVEFSPGAVVAFVKQVAAYL